jgi:hypothetical protein
MRKRGEFQREWDRIGFQFVGIALIPFAGYVLYDFFWRHSLRHASLEQTDWRERPEG